MIASEQETTTDSTSEEGNGIPFFLVGRFLLVWRVSDRPSVCLSDSYFEMFFNIFYYYASSQGITAELCLVVDTLYQE